MTETRLQTLRRLRGERLRKQHEPLIAFAQKMGWACSHCGCDIDGYSLDCLRCLERAYKRAGGHRRPELQQEAISYLESRRGYGREKNRQGQIDKGPGWRYSVRPAGGAGNAILRASNHRLFVKK